MVRANKLKIMAIWSKWGLWRTLLVVGALVAAVAAGFGLRWLLDGGQTPEPLAKLPEAVTNVQDLRLSGEDKESEQKAQEILKDPSTDDNLRADIYIQQGHVLVEKKDYKGAIELYKKAEELNPTQAVAWLLGDIYVTVKNKTEAISYYKKAIDRLSPTDPLADADREYLQKLVDDLEKDQKS